LETGSPKWNSALYSQFVKFRVLINSKKFKCPHLSADGNHSGRAKATDLGTRVTSYRTSHRPNTEFCMKQARTETLKHDQSCCITHIHARFVLTTVLVLSMAVFWDVTLCSGLICSTFYQSSNMEALCSLETSRYVKFSAT